MQKVSVLLSNLTLSVMFNISGCNKIPQPSGAAINASSDLSSAEPAKKLNGTVLKEKWNASKQEELKVDVGHGTKGATVTVKIDFSDGKSDFKTKASSPGTLARTFSDIQSYQVYLIKNAVSTYPLNGDPLGAGDLVAGPVTVNRSGGTSHTITFINVPGSTAAFGSGNYYYAAVMAYSGANATGSELIKANNGSATAWGAATQGISNKLAVSNANGVQVRSSDLTISFTTPLSVSALLDDVVGAKIEAIINATSGSTVLPAVSGFRPSNPFNGNVTLFQDILSNEGYDFEAFSLGNNFFLALANVYDETIPGFNINSKLFRWNGSTFTAYQDIPASGAQDMAYFTIGTDSYLATANYYNGSTANINSKIFKWDSANFVDYQSIPTNGARDIEVFKIGADTFMSVANGSNVTTGNINSKIYRWDGSSFVFFQDIPTNEGSDFEYFTIGTDSYLAVANLYNGSSYNINSKIYKWNGSSFVLFQDIPTNGAQVFKYFTIGSGSYLAVANSNNGSSYNINSKIYKWNGSSFAAYQDIPTSGVYDLEFFTVGSDSYLATANYYNGTSYNIDSKIYKWDGTNFQEYKSVPTIGTHSVKYFQIGGISYLSFTNSFNGTKYNLNSKIYRLE